MNDYIAGIKEMSDAQLIERINMAQLDLSETESQIGLLIFNRQLTILSSEIALRTWEKVNLSPVTAP